jgi:hypothetical protein
MCDHGPHANPGNPRILVPGATRATPITDVNLNAHPIPTCVATTIPAIIPHPHSRILFIVHADHPTRIAFNLNIHHHIQA